jgi:hypothetical protein
MGVNAKYMLLLFLVIIIIASILTGCIGGDSDGDGLSYGDETSGWDIKVYYVNGTNVTIHVTSDPNKRDTDGDGLSDFEELAHLTNPRSVDTDEDGLSDYDEINVYGTYAIDQDSERPYPDGLMDGLEVNGWYINVSGIKTHVTSDPLAFDTDGDGWSDYEEYQHKTNPRSTDTDGDNAMDPIDIDPIWNIKVTVDLINYTLTNSPNPYSISKPYFEIMINTNLTITAKIPSMHNNEVFNLSNTKYDAYKIDIPDYLGNDPVSIRIVALDNNTQETISYAGITTKADVTLKINGTKNYWEGSQYITEEEKTYSTSGTNGVLNFRVIIVRE